MSWRLPLVLVAGVSLLAMTYRFDAHRPILYLIVSQVEAHPLRISGILFVLMLFASILPSGLIAGMRDIFRNNRLVVVAGFAAVASGVATASSVLVVARGAGRAQLTAADVASAVQSGVLVAGVIAAAIGFWFNDQRRRREDDTLRIDGVRLDRDQDRVEEERFIRNVELTGHDSAGVRIGALHSLHGLAKANPVRLATVAEVMCAYLRQPFEYTKALSDGDETNEASKVARDLALQVDRLRREHQVRQVAQKLLIELLPRVTGVDPEDEQPVVELDLRGAQLDALHVHDRIFDLDASGARIHGIVRIDSCWVPSRLDLSSSDISGRLLLRDSSIGDLNAELSLVRQVFISDCTVDGSLDLHLQATSRMASGIVISISDSSTAYLRLPEYMDDLELARTHFQGGRALAVRIAKSFAMRSSSFESPLDMQDMSLPVGQGHVVLPETDLLGLLPPRGWQLEEDDVLAPRLVRMSVVTMRPPGREGLADPDRLSILLPGVD